MKKGTQLAVLIVAVTGCGRSSPTTPSSLSHAAKSLMSLKIAGTTNLTAIGETSQLIGTATYTDGTTENVTKGAMWSITDRSVGEFGPPGLLTAKGPGETTVSARYAQDSNSVRVLVLPAGTHILQGTVREPGFSVTGASVEILDGPGAGLSKTTDSSGAYKFYGVAGNLTIQVRKDGYVPQTQQVSMTQDQGLDFALMPTQLPVSVPAGAYRVTFTASGSCTQLPDDAKSRTYPANLVQDGARLDVTLSGPGLNGGTPPTEMKFSGRVLDKTITFQITSPYYYYYYYNYFSRGPGILLEQLTSARYFSLFGSGTGTIAGSTISGTLAGSFLSIDAPNGLNRPGGRTTVCAKGDHQFAFNQSGVSSLRRSR